MKDKVGGLIPIPKRVTEFWYKQRVYDQIKKQQFVTPILERCNVFRYETDREVVLNRYEIIGRRRVVKIMNSDHPPTLFKAGHTIFRLQSIMRISKQFLKERKERKEVINE
jgi:hypothetical protein